MQRPRILPVLIALAGAGLFLTGYFLRKIDASIDFEPASGVVLAHEMKVDLARWESKNRQALALETKVRLNFRTSPEATIVKYFADSEPAYQLITAHPVGTTVELLAASTRTSFVWPREWISGQNIAMTFGIGLLAVSGCWMWKFPSWLFPSSTWVFGTFGGFGLVGCMAAWGIWPGMIHQVQGARWELTPYELIAERRTGRKGRNVQKVIQYQFYGVTYLAKLNHDSNLFLDVPQSPTPCMVNPSEPWICVRSWGWRPVVGMALFPVPFLTMGCLGLSLLLGKQAKKRKRQSSVRTGSLEAIMARGFVLTFVGSLVGFFACACAELWLQQRAGRQFATIFLVPFVCWVFWLAWQFLKAIICFWKNVPVQPVKRRPFSKKFRLRER